MDKEETIEKKQNLRDAKLNRNRDRVRVRGNAVYGLGFIGAAIYFISTANSFGAGVLGFFKAIVWPAFMVYEAFKFLIK